MAYFLHIESSSTVCSVAISDNENFIALKELNNGYTHAENLHVFIQELLKEQNINSSELIAVSVSSGPGSYTGLRIGFSAAKGLAYALNIPLITIDTLKALSVFAVEQINDDTLFIPMMDARRMEVYCAAYDKHLNHVIDQKALILTEDSVQEFLLGKPLYFFGDGMPKAKDLLAALPRVHFIENVLPSAKSLVKLAFEKYQAGDFADTAYSEPNYLKEFFFHASTK